MSDETGSASTGQEASGRDASHRDDRGDGNGGKKDKKPCKKPLIIFGAVVILIGLVGFVWWFATRNEVRRLAERCRCGARNRRGEAARQWRITGRDAARLQPCSNCGSAITVRVASMRRHAASICCNDVTEHSASSESC
ncbi:putative RNA-binding Zn-ribbon protein involved in translation (DUF1610 family) [Paraburkholderia sp. WC7.3g]